MSEVWNIRQCDGGAPAPGEELGSLCWEIRLSQSEPFHIIEQGHLLSERSGEAFPTNATRLAGSFILCFTTPHLSRCYPPLSIFYPHFFWFLSHQVKLGLSSFFSSTSLHLLLSLFIFQSCFFFFPVIGYTLLKCVMGLYTTLEKWVWSHSRPVPNSNRSACVCGCVSRDTLHCKNKRQS